MASAPATAFPKFACLPYELRHEIWKVLWNDTKTEKWILKTIDGMHKGGIFDLSIDSDDKHLEFDACAESRRAFTKFLVQSFKVDIEKKKAYLKSVECDMAAKQLQMRSVKNGEAIVINPSLAWLNMRLEWKLLDLEKSVEEVRVNFEKLKAMFM